jgi:hypothetical protein
MLIEPPSLGIDATAVARQAIALARRLETIQSAYDAWDELRAAQARARQRIAEERRRLEEEGGLLLGAVARATEDVLPPPPSAPVADALVAASDATAVEQFLAEARARLDEAKARLAAEERTQAEAFSRAAAEVRATARARIEARARLAPPRVRLFPRSVGVDRRILHIERPSPDEAVVLFYVFTGRIPSRYWAPFDDSTDDVISGPTTLYADEGVPGDELRPSPTRLRALLDGLAEVWPLKGYLLLSLAGPTGPRFARFLSRGPVMEAEIEDGPGFRNLLTPEEAEAITGALLKLKIARRLELELGRS